MTRVKKRAPSTAATFAAIFTLVTSGGADRNLKFFRQHPAILTQFDNSVVVTFSLDRDLIGDNSNKIIFVKLKEDGVLYGSGKQRINTNAESVSVVVKNVATPLSEAGVRGIAYIVDQSDTAWSARLADTIFRISVTRIHLSLVRVIPQKIRVNMHEITAEFTYATNKAIGDDNLVLHGAVLLSDGQTTLANGSVVLDQQNDRVALVLTLQENTVLTEGQVQISAFISTESTPVASSNLLKSLTTHTVYPAQTAIEVVGITPLTPMLSTDSITVRVAVDPYNSILGRNAENNTLRVNVKLKGSFESLGGGSALMTPEMPFVDVDVALQKRLPAGKVTIISYVNYAADPSWQARLANTRYVFSVRQSRLMIEQMSSVTLSQSDKSFEFVLSHDLDLITEESTSVVVFVRSKTKKYGQTNAILTSAHGTKKITLDVNVEEALADGLTSLSILAFVTPLDQRQWSARIASNTAQVALAVQPDFEVLGSVFYSRTSYDSTQGQSSFALLRVRHNINLLGRTQFAIMIHILSNGVTVGKTYRILSGEKATGVRDIEVPLQGGIPSPGSSISALIMATPAYWRTYKARFAELQVHLGTNISRYGLETDHRVEIVSVLQEQLHSDDDNIVILVNYSLTGLAQFLPNGMADLKAGDFYLQADMTQGELIGATQAWPVSPSGLIPMTIEVDPFKKSFGQARVKVELRSTALAAKMKIGLGQRRHRLIKTSRSLSIAPPKDASIQVTRTVPSVLAAGQTYFDVDVRLNLATICPKPGTNAGRCVVRVKAVQNTVAVSMTEVEVGHRRNSIEVVRLRSRKLSTGEVRIITKVILVAADGSRRNILTGTAATVLVTSSAQPCGERSKSTQRKNILYFMIDDLGAQVGAYGDKTAITPNIDALARRGTLFKHQYVDQPTCIPARVAMLTGVRCTRTGQLFGAHTFRSNQGISSAPEMFLRAGYSTYAFGKVWHFRTEYQGITGGFGGNRKVKYVDSTLNTLTRGTAPLSEFADATAWQYTDGQVARQAIDVLERHKVTREPFWLAVGFNKPHVPFAAPKEFLELFSSITFPLKGNELPDNVSKLGPAHNRWGDVKAYPPLNTYAPTNDIVPDAEKDSMIRGYKATTTFSDRLVGDVIKALGCLADDTHILLWGDQGWHLGEQGLWGKNTLFQAALLSPFIVVPAASSQPAVQNTIVESIDILPTMLEMCGINSTKEMLDGRSLVTLLGHEETEDRVAYSTMSRGKKRGYSVRTPRWRYTEWIDMNPKSGMYDSIDFSVPHALPDHSIRTLTSIGSEVRSDWLELYDYASGESEMINVVHEPQNVRIVAELSALLWREQSRAIEN